MNYPKLSLAGAGLLALFLPLSTATAEVSVFGLYSQPVPSATLAGGCEIVRQGAILAEDGDIDLDQPSQFILAQCDQPILDDADQRAAFETLAGEGAALALFEGLPVDLPPVTEPALARQYILKVSYYNNEDLARRYEDLTTIRTKVAASPDRYHNEAEILITRAMGTLTPDAVDVIYYDNAEAGNRFRDGNGEVLGLIGAFNDDHVDDFIYYVGRLSP